MKPQQQPSQPDCVAAGEEGLADGPCGRLSRELLSTTSLVPACLPSVAQAGAETRTAVCLGEAFITMKWMVSPRILPIAITPIIQEMGSATVNCSRKWEFTLLEYNVSRAVPVV